MRTAKQYRETMKKVQARQRARVQAANERRGIWVCNTGNGKGKTTAALGMALRALGHGQRVGLVQFIKGKWKTGEGRFLAEIPGLTHIVSGDGFTWDTQDRAKDAASARRGLEAAKELLTGEHDPPYDLVILDEVHIAIGHGYLSDEEVVAVCQARPIDTSVVTTGRGASMALRDAADTVTEMRVMKHAFQGGIRARKGVDF